MPSLEIARMLVDMSVPRTDLVRLAHGMTPAKLAEAAADSLDVSRSTARCARKTPGNQAHVTNAKDDPLQMAADAATAVAFGFDEIETTMRVARNAWSNAVACAVRAAIGRWGTLFQCSSEEAEELRIGMAGFTSYAETICSTSPKSSSLRRATLLLMPSWPPADLAVHRRCAVPPAWVPSC